MSKITTFKCDRCPKELKDSSQFFECAIGVSQYSYSTDTRSVIAKGRNKIDLCADCAVELGLAERGYLGSTIDPPEVPPSFEKLLREIIREEVSQCQGG